MSFPFPSLKHVSGFSLLLDKIKICNMSCKGLCSFSTACLSSLISHHTPPICFCFTHTNRKNHTTLPYASHLPRELLPDPLFSPFANHHLANWYSSSRCQLSCHLGPRGQPSQSLMTLYTSESNNVIFNKI